MSKKKKIPFDLSKLVPESNDKEIKKTYANPTLPDKQEKLLVGYELIPKEKWSSLKKGNHIRYLRKDGSFKGGYIKSVWKNDDNIKIDIVSNHSSNAFQWTITLVAVEKIWKKIKDDIVHISNNDGQIKELTEKIEMLEKYIKRAREDIDNLKNSNARSIKIIKRHDDILSRR